MKLLSIANQVVGVSILVFALLILVSLLPSLLTLTDLSVLFSGDVTNPKYANSLIGVALLVSGSVSR